MGEAVIKWDGVEYALPIPLSPRERVQVRSLTGLRGDIEFQEAMEAGDGAFLAALVIVAMRRLGLAVDADSIMDDVDFDVKLGVPEVDESPPAGAVDAAAGDSDSTPTPADTGNPS